MWKLWKTVKRASEIEGRLQELAEEVRGLKARQQDVETEWSTTLLKIRRLTGHLIKTNALDNPPPPPPQRVIRSADDLTVEELLSIQVPFAVGRQQPQRVNGAGDENA